MDKRIEKTITALKKNNMEAFFVETRSDVLKLTEKLLCDSKTVSVGGSVTLAECGVMELLRSGKYDFLDRAKPGLSSEEIDEIYRKTFFADAYLCSSNAITENGELYNVDGNSNRVSAISFGPKSVILIAGKNKIVTDINEAVKRVMTVAAPLNTKRLKKDTFCEKCDKCVASEKCEMGSGCYSEDRICCTYVLNSYQRIKNRIKVIIVNENLGY